VGEVLHPDWVAATPRLAGYTPRWTLAEGFKNTAEWADSQGLLRLQRGN
jgi:nucleoside-diphosphate-sugar epimerase